MEKCLNIEMQRMQTWALFFLMAFTASAQKQNGFSIVEEGEKKQINILRNGKLITAYCYYDSSHKPFLFPVNTLDGITVTRGWPLAPRGGERTDHPHHTGVWMNYESVNGLDFWNNSTAIAPEKRNGYGSIRHDRVKEKTALANKASLTTQASWLHPDGHTILEEELTHSFSEKNNQLFIRRTSTLRAKEDVLFKDVKDGFFAIRVARELEMPSQQEDVFTDRHGNKTAVPKTKNSDGVTGNYISSEGIQGDSVWSTKARWVMLQGVKDGKEIAIGMFDHPSNIGYPAYWHTRGYGLFAVNPLGCKVFSNGKEELNFSIRAGQSVTFQYLLVIASGSKLTKEEMNRLADEFAAGSMQ